ncbi:MAG: plastocyanin/azurin family copper-binding protein [Solirubrobacteraceae bacterium]
MRGKSVRRVILSAGAAALLWPVVAWADKTIEAGPPNRFTNPEVTIDQGERLMFRNSDTVSHDVTASVSGPDGKPLFETPIVASGKQAFVEGSQYLTEGRYAYLCSLHPSMKGTLHVSAGGTPQPRPGTAPEQPGPADTTRPTLGLRIASSTVGMARLRDALVVRVNVSELSRVALRAVARPRPGGALVTVARGVKRSISGVGRIQLELTRAGRAAMRRDRFLAVVVRGFAIDRSGNRATANHGRTLAP